MKFMPDDIVTLDRKSAASNTYVVDSDEGNTVLLSHPLIKNYILLRVDKELLNKVQANIKDSTERGIDYANVNKNLLDYNTCNDLDSVAIYFVLSRQLTPRQKQTLANINGIIASVKFNNDLGETMKFVMKNSAMLDEFNAMWFNNFKGLFTGRQPITSKKQRSAIFNIAGYILAEMENPTAQARK